MRRSAHWATESSGAQPASSEGASHWNALPRKCCRQAFLSLISVLMHCASASLTLHVMHTSCGTPTSACFSAETYERWGWGCHQVDTQDMLLAFAGLLACPEGRKQAVPDEGFQNVASCANSSVYMVMLWPCAGGMGGIRWDGGGQHPVHAAAGHPHSLQPEGQPADGPSAAPHHRHAPTPARAHPVCASHALPAWLQSQLTAMQLLPHPIMHTPRVSISDLVCLTS